MRLPAELQLRWIRARLLGCCCVHNGLCVWWAFYQGFGLGWILFGPWMDRTASRTLISRAGAGTSFHFRVCSWVFRQWSCYQVCGKICLSLSPWEGFYWATGWVPGQTGWLWTMVDRSWNWGPRLLQGTQLEMRSEGMDGHVSHQIPRWVELFPDCSGEGLELCHRDISGSLGMQISMSPAMSLGW